MEYRKLKDLKKLKNNPRTIKTEDFKKLCVSIKRHLDYFEARPLILSDRTGDLVIIAGNQRYEAAKSLGMKEVPTFLLKGISEEREKEIIVRDNVSNGEWDYDILANEWDLEKLTEWGVDLPEIEVPDYDDKNQEIDMDSFDDNSTIKLTFVGEEYLDILDRLNKVRKGSQSNEAIFVDMLNHYEKK